MQRGVHGGDQLRHHLGEVFRRQRLRAVAQRAFRARVNIDDQPVGAGGERGTRHRGDLVAPAGAMARVGDDRQVGHLMHHGDRGQVEQVARRRVKTAEAALAQDHLVVSAFHDVLGSH